MWNNDSNDEANDLLDKQIAESNAEISRKTTALFNERLGIIKSFGGAQWDSPGVSK